VGIALWALLCADVSDDRLQQVQEIECLQTAVCVLVARFVESCAHRLPDLSRHASVSGIHGRNITQIAPGLVTRLISDQTARVPVCRPAVCDKYKAM
jgi:hypothetical protein